LLINLISVIEIIIKNFMFQNVGLFFKFLFVDVNVLTKNKLTPLHMLVRHQVIKYHEQAQVLVEVSNYYQEKKSQVKSEKILKLNLRLNKLNLINWF